MKRISPECKSLRLDIFTTNSCFFSGDSAINLRAWASELADSKAGIVLSLLAKAWKASNASSSVAAMYSTLPTALR